MKSREIHEKGPVVRVALPAPPASNTELQVAEDSKWTPGLLGGYDGIILINKSLFVILPWT